MHRDLYGTGRIPGPLRAQKNNSSQASILLARRGSQLRSGNAAVASEAGKVPEKDGEDNVYLTTPFQWNLLVERSGRIVRKLGRRGPRKSQHLCCSSTESRAAEKNTASKL